MTRYPRIFCLIICIVISAFAFRNVKGQGLALDENNWDKFRPNVSLFIQPLNVIGYYPRVHIGISVLSKNGFNISLMTAIKFPGLRNSASHYSVLEFRPELTYLLLKPYYKVNLRVGVELLYTHITENRTDGYYIDESGEEMYYSKAILDENRRGIRLIAAMVLATNPRFVMEPFVGVGIGLRSFEYSHVHYKPPPGPSGIWFNFEDFFDDNIWDTEEKVHKGSQYYFMPTVGIKIGFRVR